MSPLHLNTPLLRAPPELFGECTVWLKMDALQPGGSFKMRGVGRLVQQRVAQGAKAVVCASGGNAGTMRVLVEPTCGAALAALDAHPALFARFKAPLVEVCGGIGVSLARLAAFRRDLGLD